MVNWDAVAAVAAVAQGIGTLGAFYLTIHLLRETATTARLASEDQANRLAPLLVLAVDIQTPPFDVPRVAARIQNDGLGPAVRVAVHTKPSLLLQPLAGEIGLTWDHRVAQLLPGRSVRLAGQDPAIVSGAEICVTVSCEDLAGKTWCFDYLTTVPKTSEPAEVLLAGITRPSDDKGRRRRNINERPTKAPKRG